MKDFQDVLSGTARLREALIAVGETAAAERIRLVLYTYYTTTSEALVEVLGAIEGIRERIDKSLSLKQRREVDELVWFARDLLGFK